jgi:hypothetical protein
MALKGKRKAQWQKIYVRLWRRADTLARHRAITKFPPIKTMTQLDNLLTQGVLPEVAEYIAAQRKRILKAAPKA